LGFVNPTDPRFDARFKRSYLGKILRYGTIARRDEEERNHRVKNRTFLTVALKRPMELAQGKKEPDMGILVACGYNEFHDKAFLRIVGFFDPMFTKGCYQKIRDHNLKKDDSDEANWPAVDDYWMKLGLGKEYVGTVLTKDSGSLRVSSKNGLVKEIFIQKVFDQ
jgi:hypothetical protein